MNLVLIGFRGSGKSIVGRALARRLGWQFVDTDTAIEHHEGLTIREIFADHAEAGFRDLESQMIADISRLDRHVISTGGGTVLRAENAAALKRNGRLIWLTAPAEVIWRRILGDLQRQATRPNLDSADGLQQVRQALNERNSIYEQVADVTVDTADRGVQSTVERILILTHRPERADLAVT